MICMSQGATFVSDHKKDTHGIGACVYCLQLLRVPADNLGSSNHCRVYTIHCHDPVDDCTPSLLSHLEWVLLGS